MERLTLNQQRMDVLMKYVFCWMLVAAAGMPALAQYTNSVGMKMVPVPAGSFLMGAERGGEDRDETPVHQVQLSNPFYLSATEVTNLQYEAFDPAHKRLRGKNGFSSGDHEAVVYVDYADAVKFCEWLSAKEGKPYRLPMEAEWEYACRAGTSTAFYTGDSLPAQFYKSQSTNRNDEPVSLEVGTTPANAWGLFDMHGNVEEWCHDWYGLYHAAAQKNPAGYSSGNYRVTRGGSHNTPVKYLRSSNRMALLPSDKHWLTGFRVAMGEYGKPHRWKEKKQTNPLVAQRKISWHIPAATSAVFKEPIPYVVPPVSDAVVPFYLHNHCPAITWCNNGDLLAAWFSTNEEHGREMVILQSRLVAGTKNWQPATLFFKVPDRNMTGTSLFKSKAGTLYHTNGIEVSGDWKDLAIGLRTSSNNGSTWSQPVWVAREHTTGHQVIAGMFEKKDGTLVQVCDAVPGPQGGSVLQVSGDQGKTWRPLGDNTGMPSFEKGKTGNRIAGIHAGVVELKNGNLLALGRGDNIPNEAGIPRMPLSISEDGGSTWRYADAPFPPIGSGQRLALLRLNEDALLLVSFSNDPDFLPGQQGMYAALSFDEGKTWPVKKLVSDGKTRTLNGGAWTQSFTMNEQNAEPKGYLAVTQTPDNYIHLVSSNLYYCFNLLWLKQ